MENDIKTRQDIEFLIKRFYEKVQADELLSPLFSHVDWQKHLPVMYCFWSSMILGEQSYQGNPFQKHIRMPLDHVHFHQWLMLFHATVDEMFAGEKAEEIKSRALSISSVFQHKLGISVSAI